MGRMCGERVLFLTHRDITSAVRSPVSSAPGTRLHRVLWKGKTPTCTAHWGFLNARRKRLDLRKAGRSYEI